MSGQATTEDYQTTGIVPAAPWRLRSIRVLPRWQLAVTFNDGLSGIVDLSSLVNAQNTGVFGPLRDPGYFAKAYLDYGALTWPNGADIAPDAMYKEIRQCGYWMIED